jgi:hypothetical protein
MVVLQAQAEQQRKKEGQSPGRPQATIVVSSNTDGQQPFPPGVAFHENESAGGSRRKTNLTGAASSPAAIGALYYFKVGALNAQLKAINVGAHNPTKMPHRSAWASASADRSPASAITSNCEPATFGETNHRKIESGIEITPNIRQAFDRFIVIPRRAHNRRYVSCHSQGPHTCDAPHTGTHSDADRFQQPEGCIE